MRENAITTAFVAFANERVPCADGSPPPWHVASSVGPTGKFAGIVAVMGEDCDDERFVVVDEKLLDSELEVDELLVVVAREMAEVEL